MNVEEYISAPRRLRREIENMKSEIAELESTMTSIKSFQVRDGGRGSAQSDEKIISIIDKMDERRERLRDKIEDYASALIAVAEFIDTLDNSAERSALNYYYVQFMSYKDIATVMFYSERTIYRLISAGIYALSENSPDTMSLNVSLKV